MSLGRISVRAISIAFVTLSALTLIPAQNILAQPTPLLIVRADRAVGPISPFVYGANFGPWGQVGPDMLPAEVASGITYLRFPGGDWGDNFDLTPLHIDTFIDFAHQLHAEPSISVRLKNGTPDAAAKLVSYVNIEKKYGVHYWSIGNEPNLFPNYSLDSFVKDWREFAEAMLKVDPTIVLIGPEVSQYQVSDPGTAQQREWLQAFLKADGDLVGIVSVHRYPFPKSLNPDPTTIEELKASAQEWDGIIPAIRKTIAETTGKNLPVAVTEVNSHWNKSSGGKATPDSYYNAVWWADVLGRMIRQQVNIVNYFSLSSQSDSGVFGLLGRFDIRPTYYVYQLYRQLGTSLVETESQDADVTITAALRSDGALTLIIVNSALQPKSVALQQTGYTLGSQAELWRLDPEHKAERIGNTSDLAASKFDLPPQSVSLYIEPPSH